MLWMAEPIKLHLVELVQADQSAGVTPVAAGLTAEARGVSHVFQRQLFGWDHLIAVQRSDGHLGGGGEPQVVFGAAEAFFRELGQLARAREAGAVDQDRW